MSINDFAFACALDESPPYFTYEKQTMLIIESNENAIRNINGFLYIEQFIESLISHESVHVVIKNLEGAEISDSLDDVEVIVDRDGSKFQVTLNNMLFARDRSGIVI
ncbi:MAG: hypothetical protein WBV72_10085 [Nitrososphaeraceae archaeon]